MSKPAHYLHMTDEVGSRSFAGIECSPRRARTIAQFIADQLEFRVVLESEDGSRESFEPSAELAKVAS